MTRPNHISYKDPAARVFIKDGLYYRYIFDTYKKEYDHLMESGLYQELIDQELIIAHEEIATAEAGVYKLLKPSQISFQSYPFEWSYTQWHKAILSFLKINQIALQYGMLLKDATPFNFYLQGGKAILLDTSSFTFFEEGAPWLAYRQFCSEFLSPLALMYYKGQKWSRITRTHLRGFPLNFVSKQLPLKSWFNIAVLLHVHMHAKYANAEGSTAKAKNNLANASNKVQPKGFSTEKLSSLLDLILCSIQKWKQAYQYEKHWLDYYEQDIVSEQYLVHKEQIIQSWLEKIKPTRVLDLGANTGKFSLLASKYASQVIALESDDICVDTLEAEIQKQNLQDVYVLMQELAETSPNLGVDEKEMASIFTRAKSDMVMALAVEHHLHISNQISFDQIAEMFSMFTSKYLIAEFVPASDPKVQLLVMDRNKDLSTYTMENFCNSLFLYFKIIEVVDLKGSERKLILLEK